jgi:hypothetical protein
MTAIELGLSLEPDARQLGHHDVARLDAHAVGKSAERLEEVWIALIAAEAQAPRRC